MGERGEPYSEASGGWQARDARQRRGEAEVRPFVEQRPVVTTAAEVVDGAIGDEHRRVAAAPAEAVPQRREELAPIGLRSHACVGVGFEPRASSSAYPRVE